MPNLDEHFRTPLEWEEIHGRRPRNRHHYLNAGFMEDSRVSEELWCASIQTKTCIFVQPSNGKHAAQTSSLSESE